MRVPAQSRAMPNVFNAGNVVKQLIWTRVMGPDEAAIGLWCVTKRFKEDFMRLLEEPITSLRSMAATDQALRTNPTAIRWKEPTPAQHIDRFLKLKHWSQVTLIKNLSRIDEYVCETTKQFLKRLRRPPKT